MFNVLVASLIDVSAVDFTGLTSAITEMVPVVLGVTVPITGIRKALSFLTSSIKGA